MVLRHGLRLVGERVLLRPYCPDDVQHLYEAACESVAELSPWLPWCHPGYRIEDSREWVERCAVRWDEGEAYNFAICDAQNGTYLGGCGLSITSPASGIANLGYWVRTGQTRQGVATAATRLLARFGFEELSLNRVEIVVAIENRVSLRVAEKAGATREGLLRNRLVDSEAAHDAVMHSFIPGDIPPGS